MKSEFIVEKNGRRFVLYAGLLEEGHKAGIISIGTKILQYPSPENGDTTICHAQVTVERIADGHARVLSFDGIGDAGPNSVSRAMLPHAIRLAETRAKARALRDMLNIGAAALEELGDDDEHHAPPVQRTAPTPIRQQAQAAPKQQGEAPPDGDFENLGHAAPQHVAPGAAEAPSPAQKKFLWDLAKGQRMDKAALDAAAHRMFNLAGVENLDRRQIARLIDHLKNTGATDEREDIPQ